MDAYPELDAALGWHARVALNHAALHLNRAAHSIYNAAKLDDTAVPGALDDAAVIGGDGGVDEVATEAAKARERAILVSTGEPRVADNIGDQNGSELPGLAHSSGNPALRKPSNIAETPDECSNHHLIVSLGLILRASAKASFASSILPTCA